MLLDIGWNVYNWDGNTSGNWGEGADVNLSHWRTDRGLSPTSFNDYNIPRAPLSPAPGLRPGDVEHRPQLRERGQPAHRPTT